MSTLVSLENLASGIDLLKPVGTLAQGLGPCRDHCFGKISALVPEGTFAQVLEILLLEIVFNNEFDENP